jgi:hypothetical protein
MLRAIETKRWRSSGDERASDADAGVKAKSKATPSASASSHRRARRIPILPIDIRILLGRPVCLSRRAAARPVVVALAAIGG